MGCDIHVYCEKLTKSGWTKSGWATADRFKYEPDWNPEYRVDPIYRDRHYAMFAVLANVRNYDGIENIFSDLRGLPEDICSQTRKEYERWEPDAHGYGWATLQELYDYRAEEPENGALLGELISCFEERVRKELWFVEGREIPREKSEAFRIVFWFDN